MRFKKSEIVAIKKLKKDGSIDPATLNKLAAIITARNIIVMPIDGIYSAVVYADAAGREKIAANFHSADESMVFLVSSFKMADELVDITKAEYDFLHRVWPGEVIVKFKRRGSDGRVMLWYPKNKFLHDLIGSVNHPFFFDGGLFETRKILHDRKDIISSYRSKVDFFFIIEEFCKEVPLPTILDISDHTLGFVHEGRVSSEEIKSLYFLDKK